MLWSSPSPSRLSLHIPVSTSKLTPGQAYASVPTSKMRTFGASLSLTQPFNRRAV
jgi:hypothetical protein